ncbi:MAG: hypothetical protein ACKVZJ_02790 [Phycisphaerales bacterium]
MIANDIIELLDREPFEPFRICLSSGESYAVTNPHMIALGKSRAFIVVANSDRQALAPYLHISALETIEGRNGHAKRRRAR